MSGKPELAFDVCWEVYRGAREVLETKRGISALKLEKAGQFLWRPDIRARLNEWEADFALAGQAALRYCAGECFRRGSILGRDECEKRS